MEMSDISEAFRHLGIAFDTGKKAFNLWRSLRSGAGTPEQEAQIESLFKDAEKEHQLAMASIGRAFEYQLCRCTLPPQVCLRTGYDKQTGEEKSRCPACEEEYPEKLDRVFIA